MVKAISTGRSESKDRAVSPGLGLMLASLLVLTVAPRARAQQDPPGCSGTGLTLNLFVQRADGSNAGAGSAVSPCETIQYKGSLTGGSTPACCFDGGVNPMMVRRSSARCLPARWRAVARGRRRPTRTRRQSPPLRPRNPRPVRSS